MISISAISNRIAEENDRPELDQRREGPASAVQAHQLGTLWATNIHVSSFSTISRPLPLFPLLDNVESHEPFHSQSILPGATGISGEMGSCLPQNLRPSRQLWPPCAAPAPPIWQAHCSTTEPAAPAPAPVSSCRPTFPASCIVWLHMPPACEGMRVD